MRISILHTSSNVLLGVRGNTSDLLNYAFGISLSPTSAELYVIDHYTNRLLSYPPGVKNGTLLMGGIGYGTNQTQFCSPVGLHYDSFSNNLVIANFACNMIVRYVFGATGWALVAGNRNGISGNGSASFSSPIDMTLDPMGNVYVVDRANHRIQLFSVGSVNGTTIAGITGVNSSNSTTLNTPWAVELDRQLNLYVADTANHRIQKFLRY